MYQSIKFNLTNPHYLESHALQQSIQLASYRAGRFKLSEQFQPWAGYLQTAIQTAAHYGFAIDAAEAEGALECLFEINPQTC